MKKLFSCLLVSLFAAQANAGLLLNIYEDINNDVAFAFSGSVFVNQGTNTYARNGFWFGDITDNLYSGTGGGYNGLFDSFFAENTTQGTSSILNDIYLNGGVGHQLGIRLNNWSILTTASNGDSISWSGLVTLNLNFADFMTGTWTGNSLNAGGSDELILLGDGYTITIGDQRVPVPEPASIALLGLGLAVIGYSRKKKTA